MWPATWCNAQTRVTGTLPPEHGRSGLRGFLYSWARFVGKRWPAFSRCLFWGVPFLLAFLVTACGRPTPAPPPTPSPTPVEVTRVVRETVVVTRVITQVVTIPAATPVPDQVTLCLGSEPTTLDPLQDTGDAGVHLRGLWADMVVVPGPDDAWMTEVLQRVPTLENGDVRLEGEEGPDGVLQVTFRLQPGWRWEDGTPLTAADFRTAWEWARRGWGSREAQALAADVTDFTVVDDRTWRVTLRPGLMTPLYAKYALGPYPTRWVETSPPDRLSGTPRWPSYGPYRLVSWTRGKEARWEVNPAYARRAEGLPRLTTVRTRFLQEPDEALVALFSGRCDLLTPDLLPLSAYPLLQTAVAQGVVTVRTVEGPAWEHLDFNTWPPEGRLPFFADARVRLAVALALDRNALTREATAGLAQPMTSWLPRDHWAYQPLPPLGVDAYDPARARALLAEAGWRDEDDDGTLEAHGVRGTFWDGTAWDIPDGTPFRVTLLTSLADPVHASAARRIQADLSALGIQVEVQSLPPDQLFAPTSPLRRRQFDLALFAWLPDVDVDGRYLWVGNAICRRPDGTLYAAAAGRTCEGSDEELFSPQIPDETNQWEGGNLAGWADPDASLAIYQATNRLRPADRAAFYLVHQMRFAEHLPVIPLFRRPQVWAWRAGLRGPAPGRFTPITWNIETWSW